MVSNPSAHPSPTKNSKPLNPKSLIIVETPAGLANSSFPYITIPGYWHFYCY